MPGGVPIAASGDHSSMLAAWLGGATTHKAASEQITEEKVRARRLISGLR
jgi:hypothetical protein